METLRVKVKVRLSVLYLTSSCTVQYTALGENLPRATSLRIVKARIF